MQIPMEPETVIACPRCGYDLRGTVSTWRDECPLEGTCNECGLSLDWSQVLVPWKYEPIWCVEFVRPMGRFARASIVTFIRSFRAGRFWKAHDMAHHVRWWRLLLYVVLLLLALPVSYVIEQSAVATRTYFLVQQSAIEQHEMLKADLAAMEQSLADGDFEKYFLGSDVEREEAKQWTTQQIQRLTVLSAMPPMVLVSYTDALSHAVFQPLSPSSTGPGAFGGGMPYPAPIELRWYIEWEINMRTGTIIGDFRQREMFLVLAGGLTGWSAWLFLPFGLALLPITRRRAKVRWAHVIRVFLYSVWIPVFAVTATLLVIAFGYGAMIYTELSLRVAMYLIGGFVLAATVWWWRCAIRHYLKMPHALAVVALLTVVAGLLAAVVVLTVQGALFV